jgi:hypothetical protein
VADYNWQCPFCSHFATVAQNRNITANTDRFANGNKYGVRMVTWVAITCPNPDCREYSFTVAIHESRQNSTGEWVRGAVQHDWQLVPAAQMKVLPDYIPAAVLADYKESCLIAKLSPRQRRLSHAGASRA